MYNTDETSMSLNNRSPRGVAARGSHEVSSLTGAERGENVTIVACCNAAGAYIPPFIIFRYIRMNSDLRNNVPVGPSVEVFS
jgi:hypothetical protein